MAEGRFAGLTVMLTGAAGGFGSHAARLFAAEGARLALSDVDTDGLARLERELTEAGHPVLAQRLDVTDEAAVRAHVAAFLDRFGRLDIGINNAGIGGTMTPLPDTEARDFDRIMAVNARGTFNCLKHQLPPMIAAGSGTILNIASAAGLVGAGQLAAYAASKHAVVGLTRSAADEVARHNVRVNALCPAFAATPMFDAMADAVAARHDLDRAAAYGRIASRVPMRRVAEPEEIARSMLWLCDPANSFMTGQAVAVDGGLTAI